ncbi:alpha/beta hydrolase [Sphingomonas sp. ASV193]|uniref:alpha/beta hydrolase n=1 Tax=Sphingomonas sp. ASV193 TaxID=3144405 RepID=UPI0032E897B5
MMPRRTLLGSALAAVGLGGCSPVSLLNGASRVAGDRARQVGDGIAYGPDPRQRLDIWVPEGGGAGRPVVVFFYGGGWNSGERGDYGFVGRALAARGFVTVVPDYRLVPAVRYPAFVEDGAAAVRWVRANIARHGGDPRRIHLSGHSAGAYIAAMLALDRDFAAGPIESAALLSGPYDFAPFDDPRSIAAFGNWPDAAATQPVHYARRDAPPMLLVHGTADEVVRPRNSEALAAALRAKGAPVELALYPGKSHIDTIKSLSPLFRGSTPALGDMVRFLAAH